MTNENYPIPTKIILHKKSRTVEIIFPNDEIFTIACAVLRAQSLSAEMRHGNTDSTGYKDVNILAIEPVGQYAIKPIFSDGHRTGIFSWQTLYELGKKYGSTSA